MKEVFEGISKMVKEEPFTQLLGMALKDIGPGHSVAVALNMNISYISSPPMGTLLRTEAREISLTRRTASYLVNVTDAQNQLVATCQASVYRKDETLPFMEGESGDRTG